MIAPAVKPLMPNSTYLKTQPISPDMKKEMSSFDVSSLVAEMAILEDAHLDKTYQWEDNVLFRINSKNNGKIDLFFKNKKWLYLSPDRPDTPTTPTSFATFMRKHLTNARIGKTTQMGFDRVVVIEVFKSEADYKLIFEMFGGGNVLLVQDGKIVNCLTQRTFRDRITRPGEDYVLPKERFDPFTSTEDAFSNTFRTSESDTVRTLATVTNLGGQYAEEVCKRSGCPKDLPATEVSDADLTKMYSVVGDIVNQIRTDPRTAIFRKDGKIVDVAPVDLQIYDDCEKEPADTISIAIGKYMAELATAEKKEFKDPEIEKLKKRIERQTETVQNYRQSAERLKAQADVLYTEYQKITQLLAVLNEQSKKLSWEKLTEGALKIPYVEYIDPSKQIVAVNLGILSVELDYTKGLETNASDIYAKGKNEMTKAENAEKALDESKVELEKKQKGFDKKVALELSKAKPTKRFWFETFKWFITSEGKLVIAGRDVRSNDAIVKKHLKDPDVYVHADIHGAPSVILKDGSKASEQELREACDFALAQSKAWMAGSREGGAFWAYPDQVSKTPNSGEFVPKGAFIIRGKRNWIYHLPLELAVGEIQYEGSRKIMCAPTEVIEKISEKYFVIQPSKEKNGTIAGRMAKEFDVPEEEISRIIPPGSIAITSTVWPKEESEVDENPAE